MIGGKPHRSWVTSHTECPECHYKFNFRHSKWGSVSAVRYGSTWTFICPGCHQTAPFLLLKESDSALPTIQDQGYSIFFTLLLTGSLGLVVSIIVLYFATYNSGYEDVFYVGFVILLVMFVGFSLYVGMLGRKSARVKLKRSD